MAEYEIAFAPRMAELDRAEWDALVPSSAFPLLSWGFLALLEESGSIGPDTGWSPAHLTLREDRKLVAAAPFYAKAHSWGEFVFDFQFAEIAQRAKAQWYPKLVGVVPATPAPAWRVMTAPGKDGPALARLALDGAAKAARDAGLAGMHILWPDPLFAADSLGPGSRPGSSRWEHQAFLWSDKGYGDFEGWLASFSKNMRRNVMRERRSVRAAGIETRMIEAREAALDPRFLDLMAGLYESHNDKFGPWAAKFLEKAFFERLPEFLGEGWALSAAFESRGPALGPEPIALAFLLEGPDRLYGRYWGAIRDVADLHFELCYYLPVEHALAHGIGSFDPGMGSPHKARRGFVSYLAPSFHESFDRRMAAFMARVLPEINAEEAAQAQALNGELPYKASLLR